VTLRLVFALAMLAATAVPDMASARDRSSARDRRCDPDARVNGSGIDACFPYAFNPVQPTRPPDPSKASEPSFPLDMPPIGSVLTPRRP
jgi:hypothetical protein